MGPHRGRGAGSRAARVLVDEIEQHDAEAVLLLTDRHRLAHLARRDLSRRLRHRTDVQVVALAAGP